MDNSPIHDEADWVPSARTLNSADVGLNALLALDGEVLADMADHRGDHATAERLRRRALDLGERVRRDLWDPSRQIFANRLWSGEFVRSLAPTSFYPMLSGIADAGQVEHLCRWLRDPAAFGGRFRLPSVTRDDAAYADNVYWRGRIWPPLNLLTYMGLCRAGLTQEARSLAQDSWRLFRRGWLKRQCPENFNAETGRADDQPDTDLFYTWGALMALLPVIDLVSLTPWDGWVIRHPGADLELGPILVRGRRTRLRCRDGWAIVRQEGRRRIAFAGAARIRILALDDECLRCGIAGGRVRWALHLGDRAPVVEYDGERMRANPSNDGNWWEVDLESGARKAEVILSAIWAN
jgi:putative isomerase